MEYYPPNSHKSKQEKKNEVPAKKVEKVISGSAKTKKKGEMRKLAEVFVPEDTESVKSYIFEDVFVPAVKDILLDTVKALLGVGEGSRKRSNASKVSYQKYYDRDRERRDYRDTRRRTGYDFDDVIVDNRADAAEILEAMDDLIDTYGVASVADLYDLVGVAGNYTDNKYGWTDIRNASVVRLRNNEYMIKMPKAMPLD